MKIDSIELVNFRNHKHKCIDFSKNVNFIYGNNAKGKTNIIEAIYFFATTKSFQTTKEGECVNEFEKNAQILMKITKNFGKMSLNFQIDENAKKYFFANNEKFLKFSSYLGTFCAILFTPDLMKIIKGGPEERRDFIDTDISQLSGVYYELKNRYEKVLFMRNRLLKKKSSFDELDVFDEQLATYASKIILTRKKFVQKIEPYAVEQMSILTNGKEKMEIVYSTRYNGTSEEIKKQIMVDLENTREKDFENGYTSIGPHREDLKILSNGKELRVFGSQGQQRTALLALKIAECFVFESELGEKPVLLLDDVFSELDASRCKQLFSQIKDFQTIITGVRPRKTNFDYNKIKI